MAQIIDRRSLMGARQPLATSPPVRQGDTSSAPTDSYPLHSPSNGAVREERGTFVDVPSAKTGTHSDGQSKESSKGESVLTKLQDGGGARWSLLNGGGEENALARARKLLEEVTQNPIVFELSQTAVAAPVPYRPLNDARYLAELKAQRVAKQELRRQKRASGNGKEDAKAAKGQDQSMAHDTGLPDEAVAGPSRVRTSADESPRKKRADLYPYKLSLHPPRGVKEHGSGLSNRGNTCYMNSTLQALLHLPPLLHALYTRDIDELYGRLGGTPAGNRFDALGEMASLAARILSKEKGELPAMPGAFIRNLKAYARTLTPHRQEDAHEFLRFLLEAMQFCTVSQVPRSSKALDSLRETSVIHKIFGGRLRSRVHCMRCSHNSDTYDPILDLSLDIRRLRSDTLAAALMNFTNVDSLSGANKYKCEKCKSLVDATKQFTVHEPPMVLTIHLKRFTVTGQKISKMIEYGEDLVLNKRHLSEGVAPQRYRLHAIVHHHGSGPNSGHYVASVRGLSSGSKWFEMNDSSVYSLRGSPTNMSNAYMLFYVRAPGDALDGVLHGTSPARVSARDADGQMNHKRQRFASDNYSPSGDAKSKTPRASDSFPFGGEEALRADGAEKGLLGRRNQTSFEGSSSTISGPLANSQSLALDDDIGEAVGNDQLASRSSYESLVGRGTGSMHRPKKRKMAAQSGDFDSIDQGATSQAASRVPHSPVPRVERGMNSLVVSPYMAGHRGKLNGSAASNDKADRHTLAARRDIKHGHGRQMNGKRVSQDRSSLKKLGARMKNRFGL